jgi:hypothetical protein
MPWDSTDKPRDEDSTEQRRRARRRYRLGGRRSIDNSIPRPVWDRLKKCFKK